MQEMSRATGKESPAQAIAVPPVSPAAKKKLYFENLDGLRFLCFLMVFLYHSFYTEYDYIKHHGAYVLIKNHLVTNGNLGVNFFFVLSGFLITRLLIEERELRGKINIPYFWLRRILRIWPLYFFCVAFGFFVFPVLKHMFGGQPNETATLLRYVTFTSNFEMIHKGLPDASILGVLWSIAIEEQFYFVWPIILSIVPVRYYGYVFGAILSVSLVFRYVHNQSADFLEMHTLSCIGDMTVGALGAWLTSHSARFREGLRRLGRPAIILTYLLAIAILLGRKYAYQWGELSRTFERSFIAFVFLAIILEQCYAEQSLFKFSRFSKMSYLGTISYGLYCLHFIGILVAINITKLLKINGHLLTVLVLETLMALGITILIAAISYRYYEKPFLKLKNRFAFISK